MVDEVVLFCGGDIDCCGTAGRGQCFATIQQDRVKAIKNKREGGAPMRFRLITKQSGNPLKDKHGITAWPTTLIIRDGAVARRIQGKKQLQDASSELRNLQWVEKEE